ncbi:MAG: hypothetical protein V3W01_03785, partial [Dehalococcoidales bacterium]
MSQRVKVLISALVVALLITAGATVAVMAQEEPPPPESQGLLSRVAGILGIPEDELVNAFKQARQEMQAEALDRALDRAVEEGLITPDEAVEIKQWQEQRPEALDQLRPHI